jgi:hypothetical protein
MSDKKSKQKLFIVRNETSGVNRLVRADKKGDVIKYLAAAFTVDVANAVDATELVASGVVVETVAVAETGAGNGAASSQD